MSADIVGRLRNLGSPLQREAADEIERLREGKSTLSDAFQRVRDERDEAVVFIRKFATRYAGTPDAKEAVRILARHKGGQDGGE